MVIHKKGEGIRGAYRHGEGSVSVGGSVKHEGVEYIVTKKEHSSLNRYVILFEAELA